MPCSFRHPPIFTRSVSSRRSCKGGRRLVPSTLRSQWLAGSHRKKSAMAQWHASDSELVACGLYTHTCADHKLRLLLWVRSPPAEKPNSKHIEVDVV